MQMLKSKMAEIRDR